MNKIFLETKNKLHFKATNEGFKLKGQIYYRLMNGYVQGFKIYTNQMSYSLRFFQEALCMGIDKTYEGIDVHKFWNGIGPFSLGEIYGMNVSEQNPFNILLTKENYVEEASEILKHSYDNYLRPWFEKSDTIERAYSECKAIYGNENPLVSEYSWLLQMNKLNEATSVIENKIEELREYEKNTGCTLDYIPQLNRLLDAIKCKDECFVKKYVNENEEYTIKNLGLIREYNRINKKG